MYLFDPAEYMKGIQQLLISDKKRIGFLCGAGTSLATKNKFTKNVSALGEMTENIVVKLKSNPKFDKALNEIEEEIISNYGAGKFNIETLLSNLEEKIVIIGRGTLNGLSKEDFKKLSDEMKVLILREVSIHETISDADYENMVHNDFAKWILKAERQYPIEIFTTNYDYLFELGLEQNDVSYYDGFTGSFAPFFSAESVDGFDYLPKQTKLWKMHGSLGWKIDKRKVIRTNPDDNDILIYPSISKYENSKKMPYTALMDRLCNYLKQSDTVLFICGYSFNDEHINERILSGLRLASISHVFVLFYDIYWENDIKKYSLTIESKIAQLAFTNSKISILGFRNAIIGGQFGEWKLKREPDKDDTINVNYFFDEDAPFNVELKLNTPENGTEFWTGKGEFILSDFAKFIKFLQSMIY